jgi:hypothetical protein
LFLIQLIDPWSTIITNGTVCQGDEDDLVLYGRRKAVRTADAIACSKGRFTTQACDGLHSKFHESTNCWSSDLNGPRMFS